MSDAVVTDRTDGVVTVTLNRPDIRNAWAPDIIEGMEAALTATEAAETRCLVLDARGDVFSAGGDIEHMRELREEDVPARRHEVARVGRVVKRLARFSRPTVAKLDGLALGGGAALAIGCDVLLASERASLNFGFRNVGLCVDSGVSYLLPRLVGENTALELVYTGATVDAERAERLGLVNRVFPTDEFEASVTEVVDRIATGPTVALEHDKHLITGSWEQSLDQALSDEALAQAQTLGTDDHGEGLDAFWEGRTPEFRGR